MSACADCFLQETGSSEVFERLASTPLTGDELPLSGSFELTARCNLRCRHCYIHHPGSDTGELSTREATALLDQLARSGVLLLLLTGGEPLLRTDFRELYLHARQLGFLLTVYTNATLLDDSMADFLAAWTPRRIEVSVYGHTRETFDAVTGVPGSHRRFRDGVDRLLARGLPVYFKMLLMNSNAHEFDAVREWARSLGRPFRHDTMVTPRLDGGPEPLAERLPAEQVAALQWPDMESRAEFRRLRALGTSAPARPLLFRCSAGLATFHVDPRGQLHPCMMWRRNPYDLLRGSVREWKQAMARLRETPAPAESACIACDMRFTCPGCAATSSLETGRAGMEVDYFCRVCRAQPGPAIASDMP